MDSADTSESSCKYMTSSASSTPTHVTNPVFIANKFDSKYSS